MRVTAPKSNGFNFENVLERVAELLDLKPEQLLAVGEDVEYFNLKKRDSSFPAVAQNDMVGKIAL